MTKSLSNLIKFYNFNVTEEDKKLLDFDSQVGDFIPGILTHGEVEVRDLEREEFDAEFPEEMFEASGEKEECSLLPDELLADAHEQANQILEQVKAQADEILEQAKVTGEFEKNKIIEEARKIGYQEGLIKANDELAAQKQELDDKTQQLEMEYQQLVSELEPNFVKLVMGLVKKLTGILVEDKREIIVYLMEQSLRNLGKVKMLTIRVSTEDLEIVTVAEDKIRAIIGEECQLEFLADSKLTKHQCILELENQIIDCSLDVQLKGLMEDLKMLM